MHLALTDDECSSPRPALSRMIARVRLAAALGAAAIVVAASGCAHHPAAARPLSHRLSSRAALPPQPDLPGFMHSHTVRADRRAASAWQGQRLAQLRAARSWLRRIDGAVTDKCGTGFTPGPPEYFTVYCSRAMTGFYVFSGPTARRIESLEHLMKAAGWVGFGRAQHVAEVPGLAIETASRYPPATHRKSDGQLVLAWADHQTLPGGLSQADLLEPARQWRFMPGVVADRSASLTELAQAFRRNSGIVAVSFIDGYFQASAKGKFPRPPR
jgi:hypothetical protein